MGSERAAFPSAGRRNEEWVEIAKLAGRIRIAEARSDAEAVERAEKIADRLERRLRSGRSS